MKTIILSAMLSNIQCLWAKQWRFRNYCTRRDGSDPGILLPMPDNKHLYTDFKTTYNTTVSKSVLMNWGWGGNDNIYYSLDGAWNTNTDPAFSFKYDREMIHGFKAK